MSNNDKLLTTDEAALLTPYSARTLAKYRSQKRGPAYIRIGQRPMYRPADIHAWLQQLSAEEI